MGTLDSPRFLASDESCFRDFCRRFAAIFFTCSGLFQLFPVSPKIIVALQNPVGIKIMVIYL